jgi:hypothetical protein
MYDRAAARMHIALFQAVGVILTQRAKTGVWNQLTTLLFLSVLPAKLSCPALFITLTYVEEQSGDTCTVNCVTH